MHAPLILSPLEIFLKRKMKPAPAHLSLSITTASAHAVILTHPRQPPPVSVPSPRHRQSPLLPSPREQRAAYEYLHPRQIGDSSAWQAPRELRLSTRPSWQQESPRARRPSSAPGSSDGAQVVDVQRISRPTSALLIKHRTTRTVASANEAQSGYISTLRRPTELVAWGRPITVAAANSRWKGQLSDAKAAEELLRRLAVRREGDREPDNLGKEPDHCTPIPKERVHALISALSSKRSSISSRAPLAGLTLAEEDKRRREHERRAAQSLPPPTWLKLGPRPPPIYVNRGAAMQAKARRIPTRRLMAAVWLQQRGDRDQQRDEQQDEESACAAAEGPQRTGERPTEGQPAEAKAEVAAPPVVAADDDGGGAACAQLEDGRGGGE